MDDRFSIDEATATAIGQILIDEVGLHDDRSDAYSSALGYRAVVDWLVHDGARGGEFRLNGNLGFGGKLRVYYGWPAPYVDCYPEDDNLDRSAAIEHANARLAVLFAERSLSDMVTR